MSSLNNSSSQYLSIANLILSGFLCYSVYKNNNDSTDDKNIKDYTKNIQNKLNIKNNNDNVRERTDSYILRSKDYRAHLNNKTYRDWYINRYDANFEEGTTEDICEWLLSINPIFKKYINAFKQAGINAPMLLSLDNNTLEEELGVNSKLDRITILKYAKGLFDSNINPIKDELKMKARDTSRLESLNITSLQSKQSVEDVDWSGKRIIMRVDYNVPMTDGVIEDTHRIKATLPTLNYIINESNKLKAQGKPGFKSLALICHLGRPPVPGGNYNRKDYSLYPCAAVLSELLNQEIIFLNDCIGKEVENTINNCQDGSIFLLENLRFHVEETGKGVDKNGEHYKASKESINQFKQQLSNLGDIFVFEAFGAAHRSQASIIGINCQQKVAGLLMKKELDTS